MDDPTAPVARAASSRPPSSTAAAVRTDDDDDSEWEYEYSATETETHLITLDLSIPDFLRRREEYIVHNTRGGFRSWMNPLLAGDDAPATKRVPGAGADPVASKPAGRGKNAHAADDDDEDNDDVMDDDDDDQYDSGGRRLAHPNASRGVDRNAGKQTEDPDPTEIQILDLHSSQPVFSYQGRVLTGSWGESIGTEMFFVDNDANNENDEDYEDADAPGPQEPRTAAPPLPPLPLSHVRHLSQHVDLLGASSARIACMPVELRRRQTPQQKADAHGSAAASTSETAATRRRGGGLGFAIPVAGSATQQRQRQAAFLESLMAVKHRRGERDVVTVQAVETKHDAVRDDAGEERLRQKKAAQFARYRQRYKRQHDEPVVPATSGASVLAGAGAAVAGAETSLVPATPAMPASTANYHPVRGRHKTRSNISRVTGDADNYTRNSRGDASGSKEESTLSAGSGNGDGGDSAA